ncbi:glycosyltransferase family 2 protein [Vulcanococcus limneticus Candia 3F8]|uniref:glycosyltransferase n=1 Tax=Vulcanococcus limneticus TaxID=2170428 RepID=UPI000B98F276|nr:glycosyltransferase family 2 protein [Vulcanococcus limneticus]MCP9793022.1 glycosyltransferase family 2 protein [Vulcanococcus limneticus MW73D5]MCP9895021.1 glycosyltransferase family 2 protein [Vulcanococcus limneticus Candia 3F8]MCP9898420.1 glycosyltransferase family 2 protein [Vulcanococcus limneticus Candia 3B3]
MVAKAVFWILLLLLACQQLSAILFIVRLLNFRAPLIGNDQARPCTVILCLRGVDPFLRECLIGVMNQDYPDYHVQIVIDHPSDPSHAVVKDVLESTDSSAKATIQFLDEAAHGRSLKCSALLQAVNTLEDHAHFIALLDADTVPHRTWLRELATALQPDSIGVATGNRWYTPTSLSVGTRVRYLWNAAAVVLMYLFQVPWGGSLAIRSELLHKSDILQCWDKSLAEDGMLARIANRNQWGVAFVPSLMMTNREDCSYRDFFRWLQRQLSLVRLYHQAWPVVLTHGALTTVAPAAALALIATSAAARNMVSLGWSLSGLIIYQIGLFTLLFLLEFAVHRINRYRGDRADWIKWHQLWKLLWLVPVTQFTYAIALLRSIRLRTVRWRGIDYEISGPWNIRMTNYQPIGDRSETGRDQRSL